jgi:flavin-dependent dehydrogenase
MVLSLSLEGCFVEEVVIVGGGIAGLSCLNALIDKNVSPLLIEGASIGSPKMCGEFLAPHAVKLLQYWGIDSTPIHQAEFFTKKKLFDLKFTPFAGAMSRSEAEHALARRARKNNGRIRENSLIKKIIPATTKSPYIFYLESGEEIFAKTAIFATGKYAQVNSVELPYYGIKFHFNHVVTPDKLLMYSMKDAYYGIVPISDQISNCACLIKRELIEKIGSCKEFFYQLLTKNQTLKNIFEEIDFEKINWLESRAPYFQFKKNPAWPNSFWIGDALAGLHPAIGSGFSHGINSAILAADYFLQNDSEEYLRISSKQIKPKLLLGNLMHQIMLNPAFAFAAFPFLQINPWLLNHCLRRLGYKI